MTDKFNHDDFENGIIAYFQGDDEFLIDCSNDGRDGFKEAWHSAEGKKYDKYGDNAADEAFEQFVGQVESEFKRRTTVSNLNHLKGTAHEFLINTLSDPPRKVALGVAIVLAMIPLGSVIGSLASFGMVIVGGLTR